MNKDIKPTSPITVDTLPTLPTEITSTTWYQDSVNNTDLVNVGGDNWKMTLFECYNQKKGVYEIELVKTKIDLLTQFGKRPPKSEGVGGKGEDYSQHMTETVNDINILVNKKTGTLVQTDKDGKETGVVLGDDVFTGKSGKYYKLHKFFREYYRSGNVFMHRFDANLQSSDIQKMARTFGFSAEAAATVIPANYVVLNPADIQLTGSLSFAEGVYSKTLSDYELVRLRNPQSTEEKELVKSLPEDIQAQLKNKTAKQILIPLDPDRINAVFYKKQDYEPFAVPMGYPVLDDINSKAEMKKIDMAIARTMQQAILLVTMGTTPDQGGINQKNLDAMQKLFQNQSVGRVLIADYTTKAEFVIPNIGSLLDPRKYDVLDRDIRVGLNNILVGENEKFANQSIKVKIFIERLKQAREVFINEFLYPEIKRVCRQLGFKNYPVPYFDDIDLRDNLQYARIYTRLLELGLLTPEEGVDAIEKGRLPDKETSLEDQEEYRKLRDKGFYEPMMGAPYTQKSMQDKTIKSQEKLGKEKMKQSAKMPGPNGVQKQAGRPSGTSDVPQEKERAPTDIQNPTEVKAYFSLEKIKENLISAQKLNIEVEKELRKKHGIRKMSRKQKGVAEQICETIIANENPEDWYDLIDKYLEKPINYNEDRVQEIQSISMEHQVDYYLASILYASKRQKEK